MLADTFQVFNINSEYNAILIVINTLFKERHYILCTVSDKKTSVKFTVNLLIKKIFKLHELLNFIISDHKS